MQQIYTCKFDNHDGEAIIGFCLNEQCKLSPQCCLQCVQEKHTNHQVDCKAFQNIKKIIDQQIDEKKMLERNLIQLQENIKNQIDKILKETRKDLSKLQELDQKLKEQQYQEFKENLESIKQEYKIKKLNIKSKIIRIMDVVNEFKILCDKLKELLIEDKKQTQDNVQINIDQADIFYKQGIKKFIQEINYKQEKYLNEIYIIRRSMQKQLNATTKRYYWILRRWMHIQIKETLQLIFTIQLFEQLICRNTMKRSNATTKLYYWILRMLLHIIIKEVLQHIFTIQLFEQMI